jgi:hypothetical protein
MNTLAKALFPNEPKFVRARKLQSFFTAVLLSVAACTAAALSIYLNYLMPMKLP